MVRHCCKSWVGEWRGWQAKSEGGVGVGRRGEHRHAVSRYVTKLCPGYVLCYVTMLCDYVMSALRGDQARTARCLRRGSAARRDQELPPARVCRAPISGTIALLNIHLQICTTSSDLDHRSQTLILSVLNDFCVHSFYIQSLLHAFNSVWGI